MAFGYDPEAAEKWERIEPLVREAREAIDFFDRVRSSPDDERIAVGSDHWDWIESVIRKIGQFK